MKKFWRWVVYGKTRPRPLPDAPIGTQAVQTVPRELLNEAQADWARQGWDVQSVTSSVSQRYGLRATTEDVTAVLVRTRISA
jgi:hypothetical protein